MIGQVWKGCRVTVVDFSGFALNRWMRNPPDGSSEYKRKRNLRVLTVVKTSKSKNANSEKRSWSYQGIMKELSDLHLSRLLSHNHNTTYLQVFNLSKVFLHNTIFVYLNISYIIRVLQDLYIDSRRWRQEIIIVNSIYWKRDAFFSFSFHISNTNGSRIVNSFYFAKYWRTILK